MGWGLALVGMVGFSALGVWQLDRMRSKQTMLDAAAPALDVRAPVPLAAAADPARAQAHDWAAGAGRFDARGPLWLDNQQRDGRVGVRVYRIFLPDAGAPLLVDLGWLPLPGDRALPSSPRPAGRLELRGLLAPPPSAGLPLGPGLAPAAQGWLLTRVEPDAIAAATGLPVALAPRVLRLDPALPLGHARDLELLPNTLPPARHLGYAVQWFALAVAVLVIAVLLTWRRRRATSDEPRP